MPTSLPALLRLRSTPAALLVAFLCACPAEEPGEEQPSPGVQVDSWCEAARGGAQGGRDFALDFAAAHALQRQFGAGTGWIESDARLAELLDQPAPFQADLLASYAEAFDSACVADAVLEPSAATTLESLGDTALIRPGTGTVELPAGTGAVVIDLRGASPGAEVQAAISLALGEDLLLGTRTVQKFSGLPSHDDGWTHYEAELVETELWLEGSGGAELPLTFITPTRLTPDAATWVAGLRLAERAAILGHDVFPAVAESTWSGVGPAGLLVRTSSLRTEQGAWPDRIPADISTETPDFYLEELGTLALESVQGEASRPLLEGFDRTGWDWLSADSSLSQGAMRAGLIIGWGVLDRFYPFFELVGRELDEQLIEGLAEVDFLIDEDRAGYMAVLGRFMHDLYDGHGFYSDWAGDWPSGYMIIQVQRVQGEPVVRASEHEGIEAGDTIVSIDGLDAGAWYEEAMSRYSAASDGYRFVLATGELKEVWGSRELGLRDPSGAERTVTVSGRPWSDQDLVPWGGTFRPNGWLEDLGASDAYYVNLAGAVTPDTQEAYDEVLDAILGLEETDKLVLDMRDYPALNYYELERHFHTESYTTPEFWFPTWTGPDDFEWVEDSWSFSPAAQVWTGPIVLLVSNKSVSSAENVAQMLEYLPNVQIVGQLSACTNGTVTSFWLPGNLSLTFTGMRLRNPDGSDFHGIGIVPDLEVVPSPADFAEGRDPELEAAVGLLADL